MFKEKHVLLYYTPVEWFSYTLRYKKKYFFLVIKAEWLNRECRFKNVLKAAVNNRSLCLGRLIYLLFLYISFKEKCRIYFFKFKKSDRCNKFFFLLPNIFQGTFFSEYNLLNLHTHTHTHTHMLHH